MLPSALWDLLSLRLSTRVNPIPRYVQAGGQIRCVQQMAPVRLTDKFHPRAPHNPNAVSARNHFPLKAQEAQIQAVSELEARVTALKETADESIQAADFQHERPHFPETSLQDIYKDLLAYPESSPPHEQSSSEMVVEPVKDILRDLAERLPEFEAAAQGSSPTTFSARMQARLPSASSQVRIDLDKNIFPDISTQPGEPVLRELIGRLGVVLQTLMSNSLHVTAEYASDAVKPTLFRLLTDAEWRALSEACLEVEDTLAATTVYKLMKNVGLSPSDEQSDAILKWFADKGLVQEADAFAISLGFDVPSEKQRDLLVKARVKALQLNEACALIHTYETSRIPAPIKSYTRVIQALLNQRGPGSAQQSAQAWDLFAHMRYVAHAVPDSFLYSTMIRAAPEAVRALDLFTEMTVEQGIIPDTHAYTAVIRACARSKDSAQDAFRIAREMLNSHRDAHGEIPKHMRPNIHTFCGLMDAAKRLGDLSRGRWVLAEMAQGSRDVNHDDENAVYVNGHALAHMFYTYAAYRPPFHRDAVSMVDEATSPSDQPQVEETASQKNGGLEAIGLTRSRGVPQSRQEVIREATSLWNRVLDDLHAAESLSDKTLDRPLVFDRIKLEPRLLNSYLSVHYAHSRPSQAYQVYNTLFDRLGMDPDAYSYVYALEAYANGRKRLSKSELSVALSNARAIWEDWSVLETEGGKKLHDTRESVGVEARLVERAWSAMIRLLSLTENDQEAEDFLRRFVRRYPPELAKQPSPVDPTRSNRIRLYAERPLVRLMEPSTVPEDRITPFLTFTDVRALHDRAVATGHRKLLDYIKWVASAYDGALRRRRDAQLHGR